MNAQEALVQYQKAHDSARAMLVAAQAGDWEGLVNLEISRRNLLEPLATLQVDYRSAGLQEQKDACIRDILNMDEQIRSLTEAWMAEMRDMLSSVQVQRKVNQAYGSV